MNSRSSGLLAFTAHRIAPTALGAIAITTFASAQVVVSYDASLGTLPTDQGWTVTDDVPSSVSYEVSGGVLHQDTTPFNSPSCGSTNNEPQIHRWDQTFDATPLDPPPIRWTPDLGGWCDSVSGGAARS